MLVNTYLLQFIPIFLILFYGFYETMFVKTFRSVLGKIGVLFIIIFYSAYNKLLGAIICLLAVLFYQQTDTFIETMVSMPKLASATATDKLASNKLASASANDKLASNKPVSDPALATTPTPLNSRDLPPPTSTAIEPFSWQPVQDNSVFYR